jgi:hypothetical protein
MRRLALAFVVLAIGCRTAKPVEGFGPGTEPVMARARALDQAFLENDQRALDDLLAPEYTFHFIDHDMTARANAPRDRKAAGPPMSSSPIDVRVYGRLAVVVSHYTWLNYEGHVTDIWLRRHRKWQLVSSAADLLPPYR